MTPVSLRVPPELWAKAGWEAKAQGLDRAEFLRSLMYRATKDTEPPQNGEFRQIQGSEAEWRGWQDAAEHYGLPLNEFVRKCSNQGVRLAFGRVPELRNGAMVWEKPIDQAQ